MGTANNNHNNIINERETMKATPRIHTSNNSYSYAQRLDIDNIKSLVGDMKRMLDTFETLFSNVCNEQFKAWYENCIENVSLGLETLGNDLELDKICDDADCDCDDETGEHNFSLKQDIESIKNVVNNMSNYRMLVANNGYSKTRCCSNCEQHAIFEQHMKKMYNNWQDNLWLNKERN